MDNEAYHENGTKPNYVKVIDVKDQNGLDKTISIPCEFPLTIKVDSKEIVTLMTLGTHPEDLALGYLHNQRLIENYEDIAKVSVNWTRQTVEVSTRHGNGITDLAEKRTKITVTTGCGQGTLFSCTVDKLYDIKLPQINIPKSTIIKLIRSASLHNPIYKLAGSVHVCCLCHQDKVILSVEDIGRHNAADVIAGIMWRENMLGVDKLLFTTGRITSEIVMKAAFMGIPAIISKNGVTQMGIDLARDLGMVVVGRAKGSKFTLYNGFEQVDYSA